MVSPQPSLDTVLHAGDVLVAMGTVEDLRKLESLFAPTGPGGTVSGSGQPASSADAS